jgi:hypothetical protein
MIENANNAEKYVLTQLRLERQSREAWQDGMIEKVNGVINEMLRNEDIINGNFEELREENAEMMEAVREKIGEFIERMVMLEDTVNRLVKNEQTDAQGYTWIFKPEEAIQRIAALETELGRQPKGIIPKGETRTREHLETCLKEKNERIELLEKMLAIRNEEFDAMSRNAEKWMKEAQHSTLGELKFLDKRVTGFVELNGIDA